jgi:beta-glucosidase
VFELTGPNNTDDHYTSKYLDLPLGPRFEFGHGLSYTSFALDDLAVSPKTLSIGELENGIDVSVTVANTGIADGDDTLMLFVTDDVASVTQPVRRLRGYRRIGIRTGESQRVTFRIDADDMSFWVDGATRVIEPGSFTVAIGDGTSLVSTRLVVEEDA